MVNITVDKDALKQLVELGIRFSIIGEKQERVVPKERVEKLDELHKRWNEQKRIGGMKGLPKTRRILNTHKEAWNKLYWMLYDSKATNNIDNSLNLVKLATINYINDIKNRDEGSYREHRFTLYEFLKQGNGLKRFLAM